MSLDDALAWIRSRLAEFRNAGPRILDGQHAAAVYAGSLPDGSPERAEARKVVERWGALLRAHQDALNRWDALKDRLPALGQLGQLGAVPIVVPVAIAASVIAVAVSMQLILRRLTAEERALELLQQGRITAEQAVELAKNLEGGRSPVLGATLFGVPWWIPAGLALAWWAYGRGGGSGSRWL